MSSDFMSKFQNLSAEVISVQKCHMNTSPILNIYGATEILNVA